MKIYVDGVFLNTNTYSGGIPTYATELIGVSAWGGYFNGYVDELRIWNVERSDAQINSTMLDTLSSEYYSTSDSGLIAYYRMDILENLGINSDGTDDLRDLSISGNHLDTYGDPVLVQSGGFVITGLESLKIQSPEKYYLSQNYPNPFNPSTKIEYSIPEASFVQLKVYDILGNEVATLVNEQQSAGSYRADFSGVELSSGMYIAKLQVGYYTKIIKMALLK